MRTLRAALGGAPHLLIGLSLGGKVALDALQQLAADAAAHAAAAAAAGPGGGGGGHRALPLHCWVLDSQPGDVPAEADAPTSVGRILSFIASARMPLASRRALTEALDAQAVPRAVAGWLASGLVPVSAADPGGPLHWEFDTAGAASLYK